MINTIMTAKYKPPATMEELMKIYYKSPASEANRYEKYMRNPKDAAGGLSFSEQDIKKFLTRLGEIEKIPEEDNKTPDFKTTELDFFFEIKSVNTVCADTEFEGYKKMNLKTREEFIDKINLTLDEIEKQRGGDQYIGVIWIDFMQHVFLKYAFDIELIKASNFAAKNIDAVLFYFQQSGGDISRNKIPVLFSKDREITEAFKSRYNNGECLIMSFDNSCD